MDKISNLGQILTACSKIVCDDAESLHRDSKVSILE